MGHELVTYDAFNSRSDLVRPLYGYVTELKDGNVPRWVKQPRLHASELNRLFDLPEDHYSSDIPRRDLPNGVSRNGGGRGPTTYTVSRDVYLEQHRKRRKESDEYRYNYVEYDLNTRHTGAIVGTSHRADTVPDNITERLDAIRDTSQWNRRVDGYHVNFSGWRLRYDLGPLGGITDVHIMADLNH